MNRRAGVIGTFVWDTVHAHGVVGAPVEQWGGVAYSLHAFSGACPPGWEILPIALVGSDLLPQVKTLVKSLPNTVDDGDHLVPVPEINNRVELHYRTPADRDETLTGGVPAWTWEKLEPRLAGLDALYVNYLSGMEIGLEVAEQVRAHFQGPIYADFHSLFLGDPQIRPRQPRCLPDADRWLRTADVIQMNRNEFALLAEGLGDVISAGELLDDGPSTLLITAGSEGAECWTRVAEPLQGGETFDEVRWMRAPLEAESRGDPTGCGDVWGAVAFCSMLRGDSLPEALLRANRAAAAKVRHGSIDQLDQVVGRSLNDSDTPGRVP